MREHCISYCELHSVDAGARHQWLWTASSKCGRTVSVIANCVHWTPEALPQWLRTAFNGHGSTLSVISNCIQWTREHCINDCELPLADAGALCQWLRTVSIGRGSTVSVIAKCVQWTQEDCTSDCELRSVDVGALYLWLRTSNECVTSTVNPFTPEFLTWTLPSLTLDTSIVANGGFSQKSITEWQTV